MPKGQQTFANRTEHPIYISIEITPDCYKLEPDDRLTIIYDVPTGIDALEVHFINNEELVLWPGTTVEPEVLINGKSAEGLSWNFEIPGRPARAQQP
jgi:hypothetical protein